MRYMKLWLKLPIVILVAAVFLLGGCSMFNTPQKKPDATPNTQNPGMQTAQGTEPQLTVYMHESGQNQSMKMEEYIAGVVAGEMKADWPLEALAAQAILARTFTLERMESKGGVPERGANASTDIKEFQAFNAKDINDNVRRAVDMTRGMVITYQGKPIHAWFHASAGGITATAKEGLNYTEAEPAYIQSVTSPDDMAPADVQNWTATFTKKEMMDVLAKMGHKVTSIDSVEIVQKGPSSRAVQLSINKNLQVPGPDLRVALGGSKLKSMLIDKVEVKGDTISFTGKGYGHGVGVSQWGANKMAAGGKTATDIINYYFKGITIEKRWQ